MSRNFMSRIFSAPVTSYEDRNKYTPNGIPGGDGEQSDGDGLAKEKKSVGCDGTGLQMISNIVSLLSAKQLVLSDAAGIDQL